MFSFPGVARRNQASQHHLATSEHVPGELQIVVNGYCGGSAPFIYVLTFGIMRRYIGSLEVMGPVIRSEAATTSICGIWNAIKTHQHNKLTSLAVKRGRSVIPVVLGQVRSCRKTRACLVFSRFFHFFKSTKISGDAIALTRQTE